MRVPEIVYRLARAPASSGPLFELFSRRESASASSTAVSNVITGPPKDKVLVVTNMTVDMDPGAAQSVIRVVFSGVTPGGLVFQIAQVGLVAVADLRTGFDWQGEVAIGGGGIDNTILIADTVYSAGVAANATVLSVFGYVIPRGNIAPF